MLPTRMRAAFAASALSLALVAGGAGATFAHAATLNEVWLHNTTAGYGECPAGAEGPYWHFVAPPPSGTSIESITLILDGVAVEIDEWIGHDNESQGGHAYVAVGDYSIDSLDGGTFGVVGGTKVVMVPRL